MRSPGFFPRSIALRFAAALLLVCLVTVCLRAQEDPKPTPVTDPGRAELLAERDRLWQQARSLDEQGKPAEAARVAESILSFERRLLAEVHEVVASTLEWIAQRRGQAGDYPGARESWQQAIQIKTQLLGKDHWQVTDARLDLEDVERFRQLTAQQRTLLEQARQRDRGAWQLLERGQYAQAVRFAEQALFLIRQVLGEHRQTATSLNNLGFLYRQAGDFAKAERFQLQALEMRKKLLGDEHPSTASALDGLGQLYFAIGQHSKAEQFLRQARRIREEVLGQDHLDTASSINNLGALYDSMGKFAEAEPLYRQVLEIYKKVLGEQHPDTATTLNNLGNLFESMGDYARSEPLQREALEIRKRALGENHPLTAKSLNDLAFVYQSLGEYGKAEPLYLQAMAIHVAVLGEEHMHTAACLNNVAMFYSAVGDYLKAEPLLRRSLEIHKKVLGEEHPTTASGLNNLAHWHSKMGDYAKAEPLYSQALEIKSKLLGEQHPDTAAALNNLAFLHLETGDYAKAEPLYQRSLEIYRTVLGEEHPSTASSLTNLGAFYAQIGDYAKAEPLYLMSLDIFRKVLGDRHPQTALSLNKLGEFYSSIGEYAKAEPLHQEALEIHRKVLGDEHPSTATILTGQGLLYCATGEYAKAEPLFQQSLAIRKKELGDEHPVVAGRLFNLAGLYVMMGDYAKAEMLYKQSLEIRKKTLGDEHPDIADGLHDLGFLYVLMGDFAKAEPLLRESLQISRKNLELASLVQSQRQQLAMTRTLRHRLDGYLTLALRSGQFAESACQHVVAWKGMVLARQQASRAVADQPALQPTFAELQSVASQLATLAFRVPEPDQTDSWRRQVAELSRRKERLEGELARQSAAFRQATRPATLDAVRAALPDETVLVDFLEYSYSKPRPLGEEPGGLDFERRLLAFVIGKQGAAEPLDLGPVASLVEAIDAWRKDYGSSPDSQEAGRRLRERIWAPIEVRLGAAPTAEAAEQGSAAIVVSPDGALGRLPLVALPGREPETFLLEEWPIVIMPAPQILPKLMADEPLPELAGNMLVLGGVDYHVRTDAPLATAAPKKFGRAPRNEAELFAPLAGTGGELASIERLYRRIYRDDRIVTLEAAAATEEALRREAPRHLYLHLATHGFFASERFQSALGRSLDQRPEDSLLSSQSLAGYHPDLLSGLALAGANHPETARQDGILTSEEVAALDLGGVQLAVLSACETGLGQVAGGEGLLGLQRAFQTAGARTVIASLWKVDDVATRDLMERFYDNHWSKEMGKLEALREAQLWMLRQRGPRGIQSLDDEPEPPSRLPPYYWAAFVLSGDWR